METDKDRKKEELRQKINSLDRSDYRLEKIAEILKGILEVV